MLSLFDHLEPTAHSNMKAPQWDYLKRGLQRNLQKVIAYESAYPSYIPNQHYLTRFITSFPVPKTLSLERYYANVDADGVYYSKLFGMSSSINQGLCFKGIFYKNSNEVIIATDGYVDYEREHKNWRNIQAIKVLASPKSDMELVSPNAQDISEETGTAVILIHIPLLMIQYRAFYLEQANRIDQNRKTASQFVSMYVLPNMLAQQADMNLFNRIYKCHFGYPFESNAIKTSKPYSTVNYDYYIDKAIRDTLDLISKTPPRFSTALSILPSIQNQSLYDSLLLPDLIPNRSVAWAAILSRLKVIHFLIDICGTEANSHHISEFKKMIEYSDTKNVIKQRLTGTALEQAQTYLDCIYSA